MTKTKIVLITVGVLALGGLGVLVYKTIKSMNADTEPESDTESVIAALENGERVPVVKNKKKNITPFKVKDIMGGNVTSSNVSGNMVEQFNAPVLSNALGR
jgi:hypothetical protein